MNIDRVKELVGEIAQASGANTDSSVLRYINERASEIQLELQGNPYEVTAEQVKRLREETGCGLNECRRSLEECYGNYEVAKDRVTTRGLCCG